MSKINTFSHKTKINSPRISPLVVIYSSTSFLQVCVKYKIIYSHTQKLLRIASGFLVSTFRFPVETWMSIPRKWPPTHPEKKKQKKKRKETRKNKSIHSYIHTMSSTLSISDVHSNRTKMSHKRGETNGIKNTERTKIRIQKRIQQWIHNICRRKKKEPWMQTHRLCFSTETLANESFLWVFQCIRCAFRLLLEAC